MVQARILLAAIALTVTVPSAQAMPWPCWLVKSYAKKYTPSQLEQMAKDRGVVITEQDRAEVKACIRGKK